MRFPFVFFLTLFALVGNGQSDSLSLQQQLAKLELEMDSLSIFSFLDSILTNPLIKSELGIRLGYSSSRITAGRDFNIHQKGYSPGISYYHKSGSYADLTTYFNNQSSPAANQSILHVGYLWLPNSKWTINPYAEKTFNHQSTSNGLSQSIGSGVSYDFRLAELGVDYAFLWADEVGHRIIPNLSKTITIRNVPVAKQLNLYPSISVMIGTATIFSYRFSNEQVNNYLLRVQQLTDDEIIFLVRSGKITTEQAIRLRTTRRLLNSDSEEDKKILIEWLNTIDENQTFALLSYNISLPVSFSVKQTSFMFSYSYSIPVKLKGEDYSVDPIGFFSFSISRRITW